MCNEFFCRKFSNEYLCSNTFGIVGTAKVLFKNNETQKSEISGYVRGENKREEPVPGIDRCWYGERSPGGN